MSEHEHCHAFWVSGLQWESHNHDPKRVKLDQVATALLAIRARNLIVEGNTDSQGSEAYNQGLSQRRADAVREYL